MDRAKTQISNIRKSLGNLGNILLRREQTEVVKPSKSGELLLLEELLDSSIPFILNPNGSINYEKKFQINVITKDDFFTDRNKISKNCDLIPGEIIKEVAIATFDDANLLKIGILVLSNFRLIFKFQNEKNQSSYNFSEDNFKIPLFHISKVETAKDKSLDPYPIEVFLKDSRILRFFVWNNSFQEFSTLLLGAYKPKDRKWVFDFPKIYGNIVNQSEFNGWNIYDPEKEFNRQGIYRNNDLNLEFTDSNKEYKLCDTYPHLLVTHKNMTEEYLLGAAKARTKNRLPVLSYYYNGNKDVINPSGEGLKSAPGIWRSSQYKGGIIGTKTNEYDVKLFEYLDLLADRVYIMDARPYVNALANRATGGGYEDVEKYTNTEIIFCGIDNIHAARDALFKTYQLSLSDKINENQNFWSSLEATGWYNFIFLILKHSAFISEVLKKNHTVLVHCSDGWDRTAQLTSLPQILLDPYFRTIEGFAVLIEKDWLSFGHMFGLRNGIYLEERKEDQDSPIFLQWLDCVHQLLIQFPKSFEFNDELLLFLAKNYNSNLYGTFMYNSEKQRLEMNAKETASIWTDILKNKDRFINIYYEKENSPKILSPCCSPSKIQFWSEFFMEHNFYLKTPKAWIKEKNSNIFVERKEKSFNYEREENLKLNKALSKVYNLIKDKPELLTQLDEETKEILKNLK